MAEVYAGSFGDQFSLSANYSPRQDEVFPAAA
jgi:hypothetical protein